MTTLDALAAQQGRTVENGMVVVDATSNTAFKVVSATLHSGAFETDETLQEMVAPLQNTYAVTQPQMHEIFKEFSLSAENGETVELTRGNISGFAPNIEDNMLWADSLAPQPLSFSDDFNGYKNLFGELMVDLKFEEDLLDAQLSDNSTVRVKVTGGLGIQKILVNARYTRFSGYRFALTLNQESYLIVEMEAAIDEEIRIPVFGIDAAIGDIGAVTGGVFIVVGLDGSLRLEIAVREFTSTTVGFRGGTALYIPTSVHPIYSHKMKGDGDVRLTGNVDGYIKFGPMLGIELFGFDLLGAGAFPGTGVTVEADAFKPKKVLLPVLDAEGNPKRRSSRCVCLHPSG